MTALKFDLDIDAEIQKLGLPIANPANPANPANRLGSQIKIGNPYNELSLIPDRSIHIEEATHLYQKRGWIQIFSGYLNQSIYLVKNKSTREPDPSIIKYSQEEIESLNGLTLDEIKTLHEATVIFKGEIH